MGDAPPPKHTHTLVFVSSNAEMATSPLPYLLEIELTVFLQDCLPQVNSLLLE